MPNLPLTVPLFFFLTLIFRLFINNGTKDVGQCENNVTRGLHIWTPIEFSCRRI